MKSKTKQLGIYSCIALGIYVLGAIVLFDWSEPAYVESEDNYNGKNVAFGPKPQNWACKPSWEGVCFSGSEWPLIIYRPIFGIWRKSNGYETPAAWR